MIRLYLDTCILNDIFVLLQAESEDGLRLHDVKQSIEQWILEYVALYYLLNLDDQWELEFGSSPLLQEEIRNMRNSTLFLKKKKSTMMQLFDLLAEKPRFPKMLPVPDHLREGVSKVLHDRKDIEHVCQAVLGRWDYFITTDFRSILVHAAKLKPLGLDATSPRKFMEDNFLTLEEVVRTLHGSWTALEDIVRSWVNDITASGRRSVPP